LEFGTYTDRKEFCKNIFCFLYGITRSKQFCLCKPDKNEYKKVSDKIFYICVSQKKLEKIFFKILFIILVCSISVDAQTFQIGIKGTLNETLDLDASNSFENNMYKRAERMGTGLGLTGNIQLFRRISFVTGIQYQVKSFTFRVYNFNVFNVEGKLSFRPVILSPEVPLLLNFEQPSNSSSFVNYQLGIVYCYNIPYSITGKQKGPFLINSSGDTLISSFSMTTDNQKIFSPDIHFGISMVHKKNNYRKTEIGVSFQYAIKNSASYHFTGSIKTNQDNKDYDLTYKSKLSYVAIRFIYYPGILAF